MADNLNYEREGYCYGGNNANCNEYGRLYTHPEAVCPEGWRLPTVQDWDRLFLTAGGSFDEDNRRWDAAGKKLKSKTGWKDGGNGTDDLGFSALPGGFREGGYSNNDFRFIGAGGYWWASEKNDQYERYYRAMGWDMNHVNENPIEWGYALSVRCVSGNTAPLAPGIGRSTPAAPQINAAVPVGKPDIRWYVAGRKTLTVNTADQLAGLAELVNGGNKFEGITVNLSGDIDLSAYGKSSAFNGGRGWIPIGATQWFNGTFDGKGHKVRGLYINAAPEISAGLFGNISEGAVNNLGVVDVDITGTRYVGGVVGRIAASAQMADCYSTGTINGNNHVGGVAGENSGHLSDSYSTARVSGNQYVGGVAGNNYGVVAGCYFTGTVIGTTDVGGITGIASASWDGTGGHISNCYSTGTVSGRGGRVGGVVGRIRNGYVSNCYSTSAVTGREGTGGIAGSTVTGGRLKDCVALNPSVTGLGTSTGRVIGYIQGTYMNTYADTLSNNAAFTGLKDRSGRTDRWTVKGGDTGDGVDITVQGIKSDGTIGSRFLYQDGGGGWTAENGKLPGLGGKAVEMPAHLK
jgi:uncharacterized protein (TIGR02145 family)